MILISETDPDNRPLVALLEQGRGGFDAEGEQRLLKEIAASRLIVPVERDSASGEIGVSGRIDPDGSRHLVAFTSAEALERWAPGESVEHRLIAGRDLAALARPAGATGLWVDPGSPHGGRLARDRVDLVAASGALEFVDEHADGTLELRTGSRPLLVKPLAAQPPAEVMDRLCSALAADGGIQRAWLLAGAGDGAADVVVVVARDDVTLPTPALADALRRSLPAGASGDIYPVPAGEIDDEDYAAVHRGILLFP